jgi:hypothetical protein
MAVYIRAPARSPARRMAAAELGLPDEVFGELNRAARTD